MLGLAEKKGFIGGEQVDHGLKLIRMATAGNHLVILGKVLELVMPKPPLQPAQDKSFFRVRQADASNLVDQLLEQEKFLIGDDKFHLGLCGQIVLNQE